MGEGNAACARNRWMLSSLFVLCVLCACTKEGETSEDCDEAAGKDCSETPDASGEPDPQDNEMDGGPRVWMPDSGTTAGNGSSGSSGSSGSAGTSGSDAGTLQGRMCERPRELLPDVLLPRCTAETRDCIAGCATDADPDTCRETCIDADPTPAEPTYGLDCGACIYLQLFACVDSVGCHDGVAEVFCCIADQCPAGSPEGCGDMRCPNEIRAAVTCGYLADQTCVDLMSDPVSSCYPPTDEADEEDAGT